jgi:hypothetical protein
MTSLAIHSQFNAADSAARVGYVHNGAISFASPVPVEVWCVKGGRAKKCRNAGKTTNLPTQFLRRPF